jgi:molybdopterin synthase catalytic subunit
MKLRRILVQAQDFEPGAELALLGNEATGGIASFIGIVRATQANARRVVALTLEHYPGMTEKALDRMAAEAANRWELTGCTVIHRIGRLLPGDNIVFVAASSPHREAALQATAFLIDWLKTSAPFWKVEEFETGEREWVAARASDEAAAKSLPVWPSRL